MSQQRIVSVGFLTQHDLEVLSGGFTRHFRVPQDDVFAPLLRQLDTIEAGPLGPGVALISQTRAY